MARPRTVTDDALREAARAAFLAHGPQVSAAEIGRELGVSGPAVLQRAGSKAALLRLGLCAANPPGWLSALVAGPSSPARAREELAALLVQLEASAREFLPVLAVLRTSGVDLAEALPMGAEAPPVVARRAIAAWLRGAGTPAPEVAAELVVGALEARAFLAWAHPAVPHASAAEIASLLDPLWPEVP